MMMTQLCRHGPELLRSVSICRQQAFRAVPPAATRARAPQPTWHIASSQNHQRILHIACASTSGATPKKYNLRAITKEDVDIQFARSGGAGGQNVNKVNTKVDMRFALDKADWIPDEVKDAMRRAEKNRFNKDGLLIITSTRHRTQAANIEDAMGKLQEIIDAAVEAVTPKEVDPEVKARVQRAIKAGNERRLDGKKKDSMKKKERRSRNFD